MSIFANIINDLLSLLLPRVCIVCGEAIEADEEAVCDVCKLRVPLTNFSTDDNNPMACRLRNYTPIEHASALFWYTRDSSWRKMIHSFKYHGAWYSAEKMGEWLGRELRKSGNFDDIDIIIPIPLHPFKRIKRGYNQSEHLAIGVGRSLGVKCDFRSLQRVSNTASQALKQQSERWRDMESVFKVRRAQRLRGRHILIVDDVFTTGATTTSCIESIIAACQGDVRISVATLAVSRRLVAEMSDSYDV